MLDLEQAPPHDILLQKVAAHGFLDAEGLRQLKQLLLRMANVETIVLARRGSPVERVRDREVLAAAKTVKNLLRAAEAAKHAVRERAAS
jgi:hypothetical protein